MKISEMITQLQTIQETVGDITVVFTDPDTSSVWEAHVVEHRIAEADEFPKEWDMPEGLEFVNITQ